MKLNLIYFRLFVFLDKFIVKKAKLDVAHTRVEIVRSANLS